MNPKILRTAELLAFAKSLMIASLSGERIVSYNVNGQSVTKSLSGTAETSARLRSLLREIAYRKHEGDAEAVASADFERVEAMARPGRERLRGFA